VNRRGPVIPEHHPGPPVRYRSRRVPGCSVRAPARPCAMALLVAPAGSLSRRPASAMLAAARASSSWPCSPEVTRIRLPSVGPACNPGRGSHLVLHHHSLSSPCQLGPRSSPRLRLGTPGMVDALEAPLLLVPLLLQAPAPSPAWTSLDGSLRSCTPPPSCSSCCSCSLRLQVGQAPREAWGPTRKRVLGWSLPARSSLRLSGGLPRVSLGMICRRVSCQS